MRIYIFDTFDWDKIEDIEAFKTEINQYLDKEKNEEIVKYVRNEFEKQLLILYINKRGEHYSKLKKKVQKKVEKK